MLDHVEDISLIELFAASRTPQLRSAMMESLSDRYMRQIRLSLFERIRNPVQIIASTNTIEALDTTLSRLPEMILAAIVQAEPVNARILVVIEGALIGAVVDSMCGATRADQFKREELSAMELRIGKQLIELTLTTMMDVWGAHTPLKLKAVQYETAHGMLSIADDKDWMIVSKGTLEIGTGSGSISVICPYTAVEQLEGRIAQHARLNGPRTVDLLWEGALDQLSETVMVALRVETARMRVPFGFVESLRPGDVFNCTFLPDAIGMVGSIDLFYADYGQKDGRVCCRPKLTERIAGEGIMGNETDLTPVEPTGDRVALEALQPAAESGPAVLGKAAVERVPVMLSVELGRTSISVRELRMLSQGQIVVLDQMVGEPLSIFANGHRIAYGEVVSVAKDQYGIRVTSLAEESEPAKDAAA